MKTAYSAISPALLGLLASVLIGPLFQTVAAQTTSDSRAAEIWYFGNRAGIRFAGAGAPTPLTDGAMNTTDGSAVVADRETGELLFYTNGSVVWNTDHRPMPNGTGLVSDQSSGQPALIVPDPNDPLRYYLFTTGSRQVLDRTLRYNVVDMRQDSGRGDVVDKNLPLLDRGSEKITATRSCDGESFWVVSQEWGTGRFFAWPITRDGIGEPVISDLGTGDSTGNDVQGTIHISPNGSLVAVTSSELRQLKLLDFDPSTGVLSNPRLIGEGKNYYGGEFSPDQSRFYSTTLPRNPPTELIQFDLAAGSVEEIEASQVVLHRQNGSWPGGQVQIGPDGKIYVAFDGDDHLGRIDRPNEAGIACGYLDNAVDLDGRRCRYGLPNFIDSEIPIVDAGRSTMTVTLTGPATPIRTGDTVTWSLRVCNPSPDPLRSTTFGVSIPDEVEYVLEPDVFPDVTFPELLPDSCAEIVFVGVVGPRADSLDICAELLTSEGVCRPRAPVCLSRSVEFRCPDTTFAEALLASTSIDETGKRLHIPIELRGLRPGDVIDRFTATIGFDPTTTLVEQSDADEFTDGTLTEDWDLTLTPNGAGSMILEADASGEEPIRSDGTILSIPARLYVPIGGGGPASSISLTFEVPEPCISISEGETTVDLSICGYDLRRIEASISGRAGLTSVGSSAGDPVRVRFNLPFEEHVRLDLYDLRGNLVSRLLDGTVTAGTHELSFRREVIASGLYIVRMEALGTSFTTPLSLPH